MLGTLQKTAGGAQTRSSGGETAYRHLRKLLYLQEIPAGQRLREVEWSQRLGVSRCALRQAMVRLEAEDLVRKLPRRGYAVPGLSPLDIAEACEMRVVLEGAAIDRICREGLATPDRLRPLLSLCKQMELLAGQDYPLALAEADWRFHEKLVAMAGNRQLTVVYRRTFSPPSRPGGGRSDDLRPGDWGQLLSEHRRVVDAMCRGDAPGAQSVLRAHLLGDSRSVPAA